MKLVVKILLLSLLSSILFGQDIATVSESAIVIPDQSFYATGDLITYHVFVLPIEQKVDSTIYTSNYVYVDFVSPEGSVIHHQKLKLTMGVGKGEFNTSRDFIQGYYRIFAYTAAMLNETNERTFSVEIPIYNPKEIQATPDNPASPDISFYPEGGTLLSGKPNKVVYCFNGEFTASESNFKLVDENQEILNTITTKKNFGNFEFIPKNGNSYFLTNGKRTFQIPEVINSGMILKVTDENTSFKINVLSSGLQFEKALLKAIFYGNEVHSNTVDLINDHSLFIKKSELPRGLINLTLENNGIIYSERLIFNTFPTPEINIELGKKIFTKGEEITTHLSIHNESGDPIKSVVTVTVLDENFTSNGIVNLYDAYMLMQQTKSELSNKFPGNQMDIMDYLIACSYDYSAIASGTPELSQKIELKIDSLSPGYSEALVFVSAYFLEDGLYIQTQIDSKNATLPLPDLETQNHAWFYGFDSKGNHLGELWITDKGKMNMKRIYPSLEKPLHINDDKVIKFLNQKLKFEAVRKVYGVPVTQKVDSWDVDLPEISIKPDDYIEVDDFREFIVGVVPKATVKKKKGVENIYLSPSYSTFRFKSPAFYFIDNIPTYNGSAVLDLDLSVIDHIEILNSFRSKGKYGIAGRNGIFKIFLKEGDANPIEDTLDKFLMVDGLTYSTFTSEGFTKLENMNYPDFLELLYTSKPLESDDQGRVIFEFLTSDITGTFSILVKGITEDGLFISGHTDFIVEGGRKPK